MIEFNHSRAEDVASLKELWAEAFEEDRRQLQLFFRTMYRCDACFTARDGGRLAAMLYMLPAKVNCRKAGYLYAAATKREYQGQGIMTRLIDYAVNNSDIELCITLPSSASLYGFYEKSGFVTQKQEKTVFSRRSLEQFAEAYEQGATVVENYCGIRSRALKSDFLFWNNNHINFALEYEESYGAKVFRNNFGYALCEDAETCSVWEMICDDSNMPYMLYDILSGTAAEKFAFCLSPRQRPLPLQPLLVQTVDYSMVKYLSGYKPDYIYSRLLLD